MIKIIYYDKRSFIAKYRYLYNNVMYVIIMKDGVAERWVNLDLLFLIINIR